MKINLGDKVKDKITGLTGIAICRAEWIHGCTRICVQPQGLKDGKPIETQHIDEPQLEVLTPAKQEKIKPSGGPRPDFTHRIDAHR